MFINNIIYKYNRFEKKFYFFYFFYLLEVNMKYFNKTSQRDVQKPTVGSKLLDEPEAAFSDKERRMRQIEASIKMNRNKLAKIFTPFTQEQLKSPGITQPDTDDEIPN